MSTVLAAQMIPQGLVIPRHLLQDWGEIEVIKMDYSIIIRPKVKPAVLALTTNEHPAFGLWADRSDIDDTVAFAATLRQRLEERRDDQRRSQTH